MNEEDAGGKSGPTASSSERLLALLAPGLRQLAMLGNDTNVTRAAARTGVSQPTLSRNMARWEHTAGTALFRRSGRDIDLTVEGRRLAEAAQAALDSLTQVFNVTVASKSRPTLAVGFLHSLGPSVVGELVATFHTSEPTVLVSHHEGAGAELLEELSAEHLDVAVLAPRPGPGYGWLPLGTQSLSLVVPTHHRFAELKEIDLRETASESYLALDDRFATRALAEALCSEAGFEAQVFLEADNAQTLRDYVAGGLGIAILPSETSADTRVVDIPIRSDHASREIGIAWDSRLRLSPLAASFRDHARGLGERYPGWADLLSR